FFIYELVEHLKAGAKIGSLQDDLNEVLWHRVARLPEPERRLLEVVAVAGKTIRLSDAQAAAHLQMLAPQVLTSLRVSRLLRIMRQGPAEEIEMFHGRIRESVIAHLTPETLRHHHAGLAIALTLSGHADPETLG